MRSLFPLFILVVLLFSCKEEKSELTLDMGYDYFPIVSGWYKTYEVTDIRYNPDPDTSQFYLKEVFGDSLVAEDGTVRYFINRFTSSDQEEWLLDSVWSVYRYQQALILTENNIPYIKLTFPVEKGISWDGNAVNTLQESAYSYESADSYSLGDTIFSIQSNILVVISEIPENLTGRDFRYETYIRGIGLAVKDYEVFEYCTATSCGEIGSVKKGRILKQNLIAYGQE